MPEYPKSSPSPSLVIPPGITDGADFAKPLPHSASDATSPPPDAGCQSSPEPDPPFNSAPFVTTIHHLYAARTAAKSLPSSRTTSLAITNIEQAILWLRDGVTFEPTLEAHTRAPSP